MREFYNILKLFIIILSRMRFCSDYEFCVCVLFSLTVFVIIDT
jgi:hypothetical protein